jgi:hypothetical protein
MRQTKTSYSGCPYTALESALHATSVSDSLAALSLGPPPQPSPCAAAAVAVALSASIVVEAQGGTIPTATARIANCTASGKGSGGAASAPQAAPGCGSTGASPQDVASGRAAKTIATGLDALMMTAMGGPGPAGGCGGGGSGGCSDDTSSSGAPEQPVVSSSSASASIAPVAAEPADVASSGSKRRHDSAGDEPRPAPPGMLLKALKMTAAVVPKVRRTAGMRSVTSGTGARSSTSDSGAAGAKGTIRRGVAASNGGGWSEERDEQRSLDVGMLGVVPALLPLAEMDEPAQSLSLERAENVRQQQLLRSAPEGTFSSDSSSLLPPPAWALPGLKLTTQHSFGDDLTAATADARLHSRSGSGEPVSTPESVPMSHAAGSARGGAALSDDEYESGGDDRLLGALVGSTFGDLSRDLDLDDDSPIVAKPGASTGGGSKIGGSVTSTAEHSGNISMVSPSADSPLSHILAGLDDFPASHLPTGDARDDVSSCPVGCVQCALQL